jgi:CheY-like chemotaxis protein
MSHRSQLVTFYLTSSESRAWLVINSDDEGPQIAEMWNGYPNHWSATAWLKPGKYRCRYYSGDDQRIIYHGPAHTNHRIDEGMDGLVSVELPTEKVGLHSMNILLVEDNPATLLALSKLLKTDGYTVHIAEGYQTALEVAKKQSLDLAICDIKLWDGDGCDLLRELLQLQSMHAIAVTGYTLPDETEHYRAAGFGAVLRKPADHSQITAAIAMLTSQAKPPAAPSAQN